MEVVTNSIEDFMAFVELEAADLVDVLESRVLEKGSGGGEEV